jgi:hypothetical protein
LSIHQDWTDYYCLKVYNDGRTYVYENKHNRKNERYFHLTINQNEIDTISSIVKVILSLKHDAINNKNDCFDCDCYNLIINTKDKKFKSFVYGESSNNSIEHTSDALTF